MTEPPAAERPTRDRTTVSTGEAGPGGNATGTIYDIGYRGYDGPRLGRPQAIRTLSAHTLRGAYGIGRGGRSKIVPFGLLVFLLLPAIVSLGLSGIIGPAGDKLDPIRYESYYSITATVIFLFIAAQAPELVGPDQRNRVLPLYFSRPILRADYAFSKLLALFLAIFIFTIAPMTLLFVGRVLQAPDFGTGVSNNLPEVLPILGTAFAISLLFAALGLAISAFTPRRAYATAVIIGVFIASNAIGGILYAVLRGEARRWVALTSIDSILAGLTSFLFSTPAGDISNPIVRHAGLPGIVYVVATIVVVAATTGLLFRRYHTVEA
jgi:ABC-2 type transport system permease protein